MSVVNFPLVTESWHWGCIESPSPPTSFWLWVWPGSLVLLCRGVARCGSNCWVHREGWFVLRVGRGGGERWLMAKCLTPWPFQESGAHSNLFLIEIFCCGFLATQCALLTISSQKAFINLMYKVISILNSYHLKLITRISYFYFTYLNKKVSEVLNPDLLVLLVVRSWKKKKNPREFMKNWLTIFLMLNTMKTWMWEHRHVVCNMHTHIPAYRLFY